MDEETRDLLVRARSDDDALDALFQMHRARLAAGLRRKHHVEAGALEDLVQDAVLLAFRNFSRFDYRGKGSFLAWLFSCADLEFRRRLRHDRADKRDVGRRGALPEDSRFAPNAAGPSPSEFAHGRELRARLRDLVDGLPPRERQAIVLRHFLQLDADAIQIELGLPSSGAARALLSRAQVRLSRMLEPEFGGG